MRTYGEARRRWALGGAIVLAFVTGTVATASASVWCGGNGLVRFSFAPGDSLVETLVTGEPENGVTIVEVSAWLTGVEPMARDGEAFLRVGAAELQLSISGAEGSVIAQEFPVTGALNISSRPGLVAVGYGAGLKLVGGSVRLVRWQVLFQGRPRNVRFGLEPAGLPSCATMPECPGAAPQAIFAGCDTANQLDSLFGAGYVPAWLNPDGEPERTPVATRVSWREVGVYQPR